MFVDEFYFHHQRRLKRWESIGHPIDTAIFLSCFLYTIFYSIAAGSVAVFLTLAIASTLIITKDEWVHARESNATENWLHSLLFIIHPLSLIALYFAWANSLENLILIQTLIISVFLTYQIIYWNFYQRAHLETKS